MDSSKETTEEYGVNVSILEEIRTRNDNLNNWVVVANKVDNCELREIAKRCFYGYIIPRMLWNYRSQ